MTVRPVTHRPPPRSWPNSARSWSWPRNPAARRPSPSATKKGIPSARARIHALVDPGSFLEIGALCKTPGDPDALFGDGVVTGHGTINGRPVGRLQPRPDGVPGLGRRDVRPQGRQADGVGGDGRLPDHRHQRLGGRPHPGRGDLAGLVRRAGPPPRAAARPGAGDLHHPRQMRWGSGVFADPDRPGRRGARPGLHVRHRPRRHQGRHRRGRHASTSSAAPTRRPATATSTRWSRTRRRRSSTSATT